MRTIRFSLTILVTWMSTACAPVGTLELPTSQISPQKIESFALTEVVAQATDMAVCSQLDFGGVAWPAQISLAERNAFVLAMNISGSFEGNDGWINLTNNFDGQGISMGLLNQCLGQGSLQPMMLELRNANPELLRGIFSSSNLSSMLKMLSQWEAHSFTSSLKFSDYGYSALDDPHLVAEELGLSPLDLTEVSSALVARNQVAVNWAVQNVYSGKNFKPEWRKSFAAMASSTPYRSIQIAKAAKIHAAAKELMTALGFKSLKSYLFFFDIGVQNGGIGSSVRSQFKAWAVKNASAAETVRLKKLLELRLRVVLSEYVFDVRSRKTAIIDGKGIVHESRRDFAKEFCASLEGKL